jgi:leader peptidase (prepilin peptidase)/N-methyltransferase
MAPSDLIAAEPLGGAAMLARIAVGAGLGGVAGSFLATVLVRWPAGRSALIGRSQCDGCGRPLRGAELIPILSWVVLRGRCRSCGAAIAVDHLAMELAAALIGAVALIAHPGVAGAITALFGWWLLLIAAIDLKHHWLPDLLTLPLIAAGLAIGVAGTGPLWPERAIGAVAGYVSLAAIAIGYRALRGREGLGSGDPKLLAGLGAWLGWQQLPFVLLGAGLLGLSAVLVRKLRGERVSATDRLPLGTLMAVSAWPLWLLVAGLSHK